MRRLTSKCACITLKSKAAAFFTPLQFGVACPGGTEKVTHRLRQTIEKHWNHNDFVVFKVDMSNAFNTIDRNLIMNQCKEHFPELLAWAKFYYGDHPKLWRSWRPFPRLRSCQHHLIWNQRRCQAEGTFPCDGIRMQLVFLDRCLPFARKQVPLKLIRALLLRSGIEQNPRPRYPCIICDQNCNHGSLQCSGCKLWAHLRCAEITHREATRIWWICFSCVSRGPEIPPNRYRGSRGLRVLQLIINGLRNKTSELSCILAEYQIDVAMIQETKLDQSTRDPSIPGYSMVRKDRDSHGGGIAI